VLRAVIENYLKRSGVASSPDDAISRLVYSRASGPMVGALSSFRTPSARSQS